MDQGNPAHYLRKPHHVPPIFVQFLGHLGLVARGAEFWARAATEYLPLDVKTSFKWFAHLFEDHRLSIGRRDGNYMRCG